MSTPNPIISIPKDKEGNPYETKDFKILKRTDGKFIVYDKNAQIGKATFSVTNGKVKAINDMKLAQKKVNKEEKEYLKRLAKIQLRQLQKVL